jgi:hypothetical protein
LIILKTFLTGQIRITVEAVGDEYAAGLTGAVI